VIRLTGDNEQAINLRGMIRAALKDYTRAQADFEKVTLLKPSWAVAYYNLGNVLVTQRDFDAAVKRYTKAIQLDASMGAAYYARGSAYEWLGKKDKALADWALAVKNGVPAAQQNIDYYK
jgi:tetratricopeptide (TPR) repeat protein